MLKMKLENFQNLLKQTKCGSIHLDVPNLLKRKINFRVKIMQKTVKTVQLSKNIFFFKMKQVRNILFQTFL